MFDITSTKLLILGIVALLVVGPKDLPVLLRTVGKYMGMIKRQAAEFRAQFDEAMRESEMAELRKEVENLTQEARETIGEVKKSFDSEMDNVRREVDSAVESIDKPQSIAHDADGLPVEPPAPTENPIAHEHALAVPEGEGSAGKPRPPEADADEAKVATGDVVKSGA